MSPFGPCVGNYPYDFRVGGVGCGILGFKGLEARGVGFGGVRFRDTLRLGIGHSRDAHCSWAL